MLRHPTARASQHKARTHSSFTTDVQCILAPLCQMHCTLVEKPLSVARGLSEELHLYFWGTKHIKALTLHIKQKVKQYII